MSHKNLERAAQACSAAAAAFDRPPLDEIIKRSREAAQSLEKSWSGGWIGYHARCYWDGFQPFEVAFDIMFGIEGHPLARHTVPSRFRVYEEDDVRAEINKRAGGADIGVLKKAAERAMEVFTENKREVVTTLDALLPKHDAQVLREVRDKVSALDGQEPAGRIARMAYRHQETSDRHALSQGVQVPPHIQYEAEVLEAASPAGRLRELEECARTAALFLRKTEGRATDPLSNAEPPWDLRILGAFAVGIAVGGLGGPAWSWTMGLLDQLLAGAPPWAKRFAIVLTVASLGTFAAIAVERVGTLVDKDGHGIVRAALRRREVRVLIAVAILFSAVIAALTQP